MVTIYRDKRDNKLYVLDEMITQGTKVCLVPFDKRDEKFVSPSTLKRWYTKWEEAYVVVEVKAFTGMKIGLFKVASYDEHKCQVFTKDDKLMEFDMASEKQSNAKNPKFANKLGQVYGMFAPYWLNNKESN